MKKILVTGGAGFLGRNIASHLSKKGHQVIGCGRGQLNSQQLAEIGYSAWYSGSLSSGLLKKINFEPDVIIHCAGRGSVENSIKSSGDDYLDAVQVTELILEYMRTRCPRAKFIFPSSPAVIGSTPNRPISVFMSTNPVSIYGYEKLLAERLCELYRHNFKMDITIIRLFSVYGIGLRKQLIWDACTKFTEDDKAEFWGNGNETRDFININDVVELFHLILNNNENLLPHKINCGSGCAYKVSDILNTLKNYFEYKGDIIFNNKIHEGHPRHYWSNNAEAYEYGWNCKVPLAQGLRDYINWYKLHK